MQKKYFSFSSSFILISLLAVCGGCSSRETSKPSAPATPQSAKITPEDLVRQAREWLTQGDTPKAVSALKVALVTDPQNADANFLLARTMMRFQNFEQAIEHFNVVLVRQPENGEAYFLIGGCYDVLGDQEKAVKSLARSITIFKENNDQENLKRALIVLQGLTKTAVFEQDISSISQK